MNYLTNNEAETVSLGKKIAASLQGGEVMTFSGELGAGKTTLIKGIAAGLGVKKIITSPTFLLMRVYELSKGSKTIKALVHIDCYRIKHPDEILSIGAVEYFGQKNTVVLIEWPEKIKKLLPRQYNQFKIGLEKNATTVRHITSNPL